MRLPNSRKGPVCDFDRTVTPMVDVVFQLLVFFVLASGGRVAEQSLSTVLADGNVASAATTRATQRATELWIHLARDASNSRTRAELNGREYADIPALNAALRELAKPAGESLVILDVGGDVPVGDVILVYDSCRATKFRSINFAATPEEVTPVTSPQAAKASPRHRL